jgi:cell division protein FtsB
LKSAGVETHQQSYNQTNRDIASKQKQNKQLKWNRTKLSNNKIKIIQYSTGNHGKILD